MSFENVKKYLENIGLKDRIVVREDIGDTVEHAAKSIGCIPSQIAKTMSFLVDEKPVLIVMAGDAKVNGSKYKAYFHQKAVMIPKNQVEDLIGHLPGAVCPFGIHENVKVYLDISLKRFDKVYTAGGSLNSTVELSLDELIKYSNYVDWIDVCKGWFINE